MGPDGFFFFFLMTETKRDLKPQVWKNHLFWLVLYLSLNFTLSSCQALCLRTGSLMTSLSTTVSSKGVSTEYLVGVKWELGINFHKNLTFDLWTILFLPTAAVICMESNQFQSPKQSCRFGLKCHHQCSQWPLDIRLHVLTHFSSNPRDYSRKERALLLTFQPGRVTRLFLKASQTFWSFAQFETLI